MKKCYNCQSSNFISIEETVSYCGTFHKYYYCKCCDLSFCENDDHIDLTQLYNRIYKDSHKIGGYNMYSYIHEHISSCDHPLEFLAELHPSYFFVIDVIMRRFDKKLRILEYGCGMGYLTFALRGVGFDVTGFDISERAVSLARQKFGDFYCSDISYLDKYDIIISTEVIEHLLDPKIYCLQLLNFLKPKGIILLTTPNKNIYRSKEKRWVTDLPPVHFFSFSEKSLLLFFERLRLNVTFYNFFWYNFRMGILRYSGFRTKEPTFCDESLEKLSAISTYKRKFTKYIYLRRTLALIFAPFLSKSETIGVILRNK